jgi:uncharacterized protein (TIRG00374 family)
MKAHSSHFIAKLGKWLPGVLISLAVLFFVIRLAGWEDLGTGFSLYGWRYILIALGMYLVSLAPRALCWFTLLGGKATFPQTFLAMNEGYLFNNLFPLRLGEFARALLLVRKTGLGMAHTFSTIIIERSIDLSFAAGLMLGTIPLVLDFSWARPVAVATLILIAGGLLGLYLIARNREKVHTWVTHLAGKNAFLKKKIVPQLDSLINGMGALKKPGQFVLAIIFMASSWLIAISEYHFMLRVIAPQAPFWWAMFTVGVLAMGIALPSAPAALGVFEGSVVAALAVFQVPYASALAFGMIMHFMHFVVNCIIGFLALAWERQSLLEIWKTLMNAKENPATEEASAAADLP